MREGICHLGLAGHGLARRGGLALGLLDARLQRLEVRAQPRRLRRQRLPRRALHALHSDPPKP